MESPSHWYPPSMWQVDFRRRIFHKSHLQAWINCPWKFKREYVDSAHVRDELRENNFLIGRVMHMTSEKFWDSIRYDVLNKMTDKLYKVNDLSQAFAIINPWMRYLAADIVPPGRWSPDIVKYTENLSSFEAQRWMSYLEADVECVPGYWIPKYTEVKVTDKESRRTGTIDRIEKLINRPTYAVVELKAKIGHRISNIRRELGWYYLLAQHAWKNGSIDRQITHWGSFGYKDGESFFEPVKRITLTAMEKRFAIFQEAIRENEYPKKMFSYLCMWCEYGGECYENLDEWKEKYEHNEEDEIWTGDDEEIGY